MRQIINFNRKWAFTKMADAIPETMPAKWDIVNLPHSWNAIDGQDGNGDYYRGTAYYAKMIDSDALMADAWHHRSDAFSSIGALIGIGGAKLGFPIMDSIASIVISAFIAKASYDIFKDAMDKMIDHACDDKTETQIRTCVMENENVMGIDLLKTRIFGNKIYVDVEILADAACTLKEAHLIARKVHNKIEETFPKVKHIMVYVNPAENSE